ncbi:hypothetical protein [Exiguobacterium chiriqhucha]|uniref:hypothetical protein n=1 Tax=Exiguobacterium chiriqhucha TaxID=1385984 RepID=UPI000495963F|nr:hypothetical protein [Exiguobacterium chiriqhucha]
MFDKNIKISGMHSYYVEELKNQNFFNRYIDVYVHAPLIGFQYGRSSSPDKTSEYANKDINIFLEQVMSEANNLEFIFRLIMLLDDSENLPIEERITRAFRDDALSYGDDDTLNDVGKRHENNMELFNSYVLGGIEILYEKIIVQGATELDYIKNSFDFMKEYHLSMNLKSADELLKDL